MPPRKKKSTGEAAPTRAAASPVPDPPLSLNQQRKAGIPKRDRRKRFNT